MWLELTPLIELLHHLVGIQKLKSHVFIGMLINLWILFGVIAFNKEVSLRKFYVFLGLSCSLLGDIEMFCENYAPFL